MRSRIRGVALVIAAVVVAGMLLVPTTARADTDKPTWKVGNYWVYKGDALGFPFGGGSGGGSADVRMRLEVLGTESVAVEGTSYDAYHLKIEVNSTMGSFTVNIPGDAWFRASDLSLVKMKLTATLGTPPYASTMTVTVTTSPPLAIQWPLRANATWPVSSTVKGVLQFTGVPDNIQTQAISGTMAVGASESVAVPAGRFDTTPVTFTMSDGNRSKSSWSSEAGNYAQTKSYDKNGTETSSSELTSYSYQKPSATSGGFSGLGTFMGLDWLVWIAVLVIAIGAGISAVGVRRRRKRAEPPPGSMATMPPPESAMEPGPPREPPVPPP